MVIENPGFITLADISTEKLEQLVRETPLDDDSDDEYLNALLTELTSREDAAPVDVGAAWRQFQEIILKSSGRRSPPCGHQFAVTAQP
ncbi:MAG: hypothetical protein LBC28_02970 [Oscillospiraceae bacterium]|jgi:hypothetical protein|nr:hypothetical protein [Oscillospiraceae bacterium]